MVKHKHKSNILKPMMPTFALAGGSMGMGIIGGAMASKLPAGMTNPMISAGKATANIIPMTVAVGGLGVTTTGIKRLMKEMRKLK